MDSKPGGLSYVTCVCIAIGCLSGCGGDDSPLVPVTGIVLLDGQPLTTGTVVTTVANGRGARGVIGSNGEFKLETPGMGEGAEPGTHYIAVVAVESTDPGNPEAPTKSLVPTEYASAYNSGLVIEVKSDGENHPELKLSSKK